MSTPKDAQPPPLPTGRSRFDRRPRRLAGALAVAAAGLVASACSAPAARSVASINGHQRPAAAPVAAPSESGVERQLVSYTRCLRAHGVSEPDPFRVPGHSGYTVYFPSRTSANSAALDACDHLIPPLFSSKFAGARRQLAQWLPALTAYARCMRQHDIAMLDPSPVPTPGGLVTLGDVPGIDNSFGRYSPQFRAADGACRRLLPSAVHDSGTGP